MTIRTAPEQWQLHGPAQPARSSGDLAASAAVPAAIHPRAETTAQWSGAASPWPESVLGFARSTDCASVAASGAVSGFAEPSAGDRNWPAGQSDRAAEHRPPGPLDAEAVKALIGYPLAVIEREVIEATIAHCDGSVPRAAVLLGVSASTLYRKLAAWSGPRRRG